MKKLTCSISMSSNNLFYKFFLQIWKCLKKGTKKPCERRKKKKKKKNQQSDGEGYKNLQEDVKKSLLIIEKRIL